MALENQKVYFYTQYNDKWGTYLKYNPVFNCTLLLNFNIKLSKRKSYEINA